MQNIIEICKEFGLEIPADKQAEFNKKVSENYLTKAEHDKKIGKIETERDNWKEKAETAENTLKGFDGKDFDTITKERDEWKKKAEDAEKDYNAKLAEREKSDLLKDAFANIKFSSEAAKKSIMSQISESVQVKNGRLIGFNDLLDEAKKNDATAFVDEVVEKLNENKPKFTEVKKNNNGSDSPMSRSDIMKIKDASERQAAIARNLSEFKK